MADGSQAERLEGKQSKRLVASLPLHELYFADYAAGFDRNAFAAGSSPALLSEPGSEETASAVGAAAGPITRAALALAEKNTKGPCGIFGRCPDAMIAELAHLLGPKVWGPGDLAGVKATRESNTSSVSETAWLMFGLDKPRLSRALAADKTSVTMLSRARTPFATLQYCLLLSGSLRWKVEESSVVGKPRNRIGLNTKTEAVEKPYCKFNQRPGQVVVLPPKCKFQAKSKPPKPLSQVHESKLFQKKEVAQEMKQVMEEEDEEEEEEGEENGKRVLMVTWLAHNPGSLDIASGELVQELRKHTVPLPVDVHALVKSALERRVRCVNLARLELAGPALTEEIGLLLRCAARKLESETVVESDVEQLAPNCALKPFVAQPGERPALGELRRCGSCQTPIYSRYYYCPQCGNEEQESAPPGAGEHATAAATTASSEADSRQAKCGVFCLDCVAEGFHCDHLREYELRELVPQSLCRALVEHAKMLFSRLATCCGGDLQRLTALLPAAASDELMSTATVAHALVCLAADDQRATCHQCKLARPRYKVVQCTNMRAYATKTRYRPCVKKYCVSCLRNRYGLKQAECLRQRNWCCPFCEGRCDCGACVRKKLSAEAAASATAPATAAAIAANNLGEGGHKTPLSESALVSPVPRIRKRARRAAPATPVQVPLDNSSNSSSSNISSSNGNNTAGTPATVLVTVPETPTWYYARLGPYSPEYLARALSAEEIHAAALTEAPKGTVPMFFVDDRMVMFVRRTDVRPYNPTYVPPQVLAPGSPLCVGAVPPQVLLAQSQAPSLTGLFAA